MKSPQAPPPKPMPVTSMPDRVQPDQRSDFDQMKAGISSTGTTAINPGK